MPRRNTVFSMLAVQEMEVALEFKGPFGLKE